MDVKRACVLLASYAFATAVVRDGLGPFVSVFLVVARDYTPGLAGVLWTVREISMTVSGAPLGNLFDKTQRKIPWLIAFTIVSSVASTVLAFTDNFIVLLFRSIVGGLAASAIAPGIASITLGTVGADMFDLYMPMIERANHAGSMVAATVVAVVAYIIYPDLRWIFLSIGIFSAIGIVCLAVFPRRLINQRVASGLQRQACRSLDAHPNLATYASLLRNRSIVLFAFSVMLFHLGNAAILPLLGQVIALDSGATGMVWAASLVIIAQVLSIPATYLLNLTNVIGHKGVLCICYLTVPTRAILIIVIDRLFDGSKFALAATQLVDGIGAGINGVGVNSVTRILTQGTGRFGVTLGAVVASWQVGASLSNLIGGFLADVSYEVAFVFLGVCGMMAVLTLLPISITDDVGKRDQNGLDVDVESYLSQNHVDRVTSDRFRKQSPQVQQIVIELGDLQRSSPSSALRTRMQEVSDALAVGPNVSSTTHSTTVGQLEQPQEQHDPVPSDSHAAVTMAALVDLRSVGRETKCSL